MAKKKNITEEVLQRRLNKLDQQRFDLLMKDPIDLAAFDELKGRSNEIRYLLQTLKPVAQPAEHA